MGQLEKGFKKAWENLEIIDNSFSNEDTIWLKSKVCDKWEQSNITCPWYLCIKTLVEDRFHNNGAVITNNQEGIDLDLIGKIRKTVCRKTLKEDDNIKKDLDDNVISKSIYVFFQIRYTKTKTYKRYIYIYSWYNSKWCCGFYLIIYTSYIFTL